MDKTKIIKGIVSGFTGYGKARSFIRQAFESDDVTGILQAATDGLLKPDAKLSEEPNKPFASFKSTVSAIAKEYGKAVSIKQGTVSVTDAAKGEPESDEGEGDADPGDEAGETQDDALWSAVELVLANLDKPAILGAIRGGLDKLAKG